MRITCPSCTARYEVDAALVPEDGRDVQCSACGHTWMQFRDGRVEEMDDDTPPATEPAPAEVAADTEAEATGDEPEGHVTAPPVQRRELDSDARRILREEAQHEAARRRARRVTAVESQPDPGIEDRPTANRPPAPEQMPAAVSEDAPRDSRRRRGGSGMFPDIEEINSTLSAGDEAERDAGNGTSRSGTGGFRNGFLLMVTLAILIMALYLAAPWIAANVPALEPAMAAYVGGINGFRMAVEGVLQGAAEWIGGLSG